MSYIITCHAYNCIEKRLIYMSIDYFVPDNELCQKKNLVELMQVVTPFLLKCKSQSHEVVQRLPGECYHNHWDT